MAEERFIVAKEGYVGFKATIVPDPENGFGILVWSPDPGVCEMERIEALMDEMMDYATETPYSWKDWNEWWNFSGGNPKEDVE